MKIKDRIFAFMDQDGLLYDEPYCFRVKMGWYYTDKEVDAALAELEKNKEIGLLKFARSTGKAYQVLNTSVKYDCEAIEKSFVHPDNQTKNMNTPQKLTEFSTCLGEAEKSKHHRQGQHIMNELSKYDMDAYNYISANDNNDCFYVDSRIDNFWKALEKYYRNNPY